jgi:hypothetical protein
MCQVAKTPVTIAHPAREAECQSEHLFQTLHHRAFQREV